MAVLFMMSNNAVKYMTIYVSGTLLLSCYHVLSTSSTNTPLHLILSLLLLFYVHQQEVRHYICWGLFCFLNQLLNVKIQHINVDFTRT